MADFVLFADSACDLPQELAARLNIRILPLTFVFEGEETIHEDHSVPSAEFYAKLRGGSMVRTSGVNMQRFMDAFEPELAAGRDVLYIGFSSALSVTTSAARMAAQELSSAYPERKALVVDSLSASAGYGLLLRMVCDRIAAGASLEEAAEYAEKLKMRICHWFTVDDLNMLQRGGRISAAVAFVGGLLGIKPILHMDDSGHLVYVGKVRGRKAALRAICDKYGELCADPSAPVFLCQADCVEDAETVQRMLQETYKISAEQITEVGSVIGAHTGGGAVSVFFVGKHR